MNIEGFKPFPTEIQIAWQNTYLNMSDLGIKINLGKDSSTTVLMIMAV
jgi:hypothetical protein